MTRLPTRMTSQTSTNSKTSKASENSPNSETGTAKNWETSVGRCRLTASKPVLKVKFLRFQRNNMMKLFQALLSV